MPPHLIQSIFRRPDDLQNIQDIDAAVPIKIHAACGCFAGIQNRVITASVSIAVMKHFIPAVSEMVLVYAGCKTASVVRELLGFGQIIRTANGQRNCSATPHQHQPADAEQPDMETLSRLAAGATRDLKHPIETLWNGLRGE